MRERGDRLTHLRTARVGWSSAGLALCVLGLMVAACAEGVKLVSETGNGEAGSGGIVIYPYRGGNGYLTSPLRAEALRLIEQRCPGGYSIVREGEAKGRSRTVENAAGTEVISEKRWGMQFRCK
jgi:hypothetical protein